MTIATLCRYPARTRGVASTTTIMICSGRFAENLSGIIKRVVDNHNDRAERDKVKGALTVAPLTKRVKHVQTAVVVGAF